MKSNLNDIRKNDILNDIPLLTWPERSITWTILLVFPEPASRLPTFFKSLRRLLQELDHVQQSCRSVNLVDFPLGINVKLAAILPENVLVRGDP